MVRPEWKNLNGLWEYAVTPKEAALPETFEGSILVPFAIETALSGVKRSLQPHERLWYHRSFTIPPGWSSKRILLHFEAVDWHCICSVNSKEIGEHTGGYVPFSFDITKYLTTGENELVVAVWDPTDTHWQQRGKQVLNPKATYYTATSGIWQTVWLEPVPFENHIEYLRLQPDIDSESLRATIYAVSAGRARVTVYAAEKQVSRIEGDVGQELRPPIPAPRLWCPQDPFLYDLKVELLKGEQVIDSVKSYFGMRKISVDTDASGHRRVFLNNKPIFLHGPLDQGYWPDGGLTPPSDEALIFDIEKTLQLGFNMTRKHVKVEPRRWYYHADRLGLIVIQDMVSGGKDKQSEKENVLTVLFDIQRKDTGKKALRKAWRETPESRQDFERELVEIINHLYNAPSIVAWVPFNESWGQYEAARMANLVRAHDPFRLVDHASGWQDQRAGDFCSRHTYVIKLKPPPRKDERIYFISEYGGYNCQEPGHLWNKESKFGYRMFKDRRTLAEAFAKLIRAQLIPLIPKGLGAAVYTQFSDVEIESNGFFTFDREILKIDKEQTAALNKEIYTAFETVEKQHTNGT